jgi:hypothetical protein
MKRSGTPQNVSFFDVLCEVLAHRDQQRHGYQDGLEGNPPSKIRANRGLVYDDQVDTYNEAYAAGQRDRIANKQG